jgi:hypothetical protein
MIVSAGKSLEMVPGIKKAAGAVNLTAAYFPRNFWDGLTVREKFGLLGGGSELQLRH